MLLHTGIFELIPTGKLLVCPGQNQLEVICSSGESSFLEWNLTFPVFGEPLLTDTRVIASTNAVGRVNGLQVERVLFTFNIISISPLASRLSWNETTPILNGSSIMCTERDTGMDRKSELILDVVNTTTGLCACTTSNPHQLCLFVQLHAWLISVLYCLYSLSTFPSGPNSF